MSWPAVTPGHHVPGGVLGNVAARPADDHDDLGLVVDDGAGQRDVRRRSGQATGELGEREGCRRQLHPALLGVALVVEADAEDLPGVGNRRAEDDLVEPPVRLVSFTAPCELVQLLETGEARRCGRERVVVGQPGHVVEAARVLEGRPTPDVDQSEHVRSPPRPTPAGPGSGPGMQEIYHMNKSLATR